MRLITLSNGVELDININYDNTEINIKNEILDKILIDNAINTQDVGLNLAVAQLSFMADYSLLSLLVNAKSLTFSISFKQGLTQRQTYHFKRSNIDATGTFNLVITIYGILDTNGLDTETEQKIYKDKSSIDVIDEICKSHNIKVKKDVNSTTDTMVWINPNFTHFKFLANVIKHINVENDFIMCALDTIKDDTTLIIKSYNTLISQKPKNKLIVGINLAHKDENTFTATNIRLETNLAKNSFIFNDNTMQPILKCEAERNDIFSFEAKEIKQKAPKIERPTTILPLKLDCMNAHDKWHESYFANIKSLTLLSRIIIYCDIIENLNLNLLDTIEFTCKDSDTNKSADKLDGTYIIIGLARMVENGTYKNRLTLARNDK